MKKKSSLGVLSLFFIIIGTIITLENYDIIKGVTNLWPVIPLLIGLGFILLFFERKKDDPVLIWLSTFLILLSIFFYILNRTSWKSLSYLWPTFLGILGISFLVSGFFTKSRILVYLSVLFIALFLALFFVFTVSLKLWPMSLVVFGISLLIINHFNNKLRGKSK